MAHLGCGRRDPFAHFGLPQPLERVRWRQKKALLHPGKDARATLENAPFATVLSNHSGPNTTGKSCVDRAVDSPLRPLARPPARAGAPCRRLKNPSGRTHAPPNSLPRPKSMADWKITNTKFGATARLSEPSRGRPSPREPDSIRVRQTTGPNEVPPTARTSGSDLPAGPLPDSAGVQPRHEAHVTMATSPATTHPSHARPTGTGASVQVRPHMTPR